MKVVAGMTTIPPRRSIVQLAIRSIIEQVDQLFVHFNEETIPAWVKNYPKLVPLTATVTRHFDASAKFWYADTAKFRGIVETGGVLQGDRDIVYFSIDDDIVYPSDYVKTLLALLDRHKGHVAAVHGSLLREPINTYHSSLIRFRFAKALAADQQVHIGGTGTMAFRMSDIPIDFEKIFGYPNMADVWMAVYFRELKKHAWICPRDDGWMKPIPVKKGVFELRGGGFDFVETQIIKEAAPWPKLAIAPANLPAASPHASYNTIKT